MTFRCRALSLRRTSPFLSREIKGTMAPRVVRFSALEQSWPLLDKYSAGRKYLDSDAIFWLGATACWSLNKTMNMRFGCRLSALIHGGWKGITALFILSPPILGRGVKIETQLNWRQVPLTGSTDSYGNCSMAHEASSRRLPGLTTRIFWHHSMCTGAFLALENAPWVRKCEGMNMNEKRWGSENIKSVPGE